MNIYTARVTGIRQYGSNSIITNVLSGKYPTIKLVDGKAGVLGVASISGYVSITDSSYSDVASFKAAMQGVMLYYELAEPEEYPLPKVDNNYISSDYGVEQFDSVVPCNANNLYYMRSLAGETRNFLDRMYDNTTKTDAKEVADYITNGIEDNKELATNAPNLALRALFVAAGAEYNDSGEDKTKTAPWGETVTHKAGHYYLNGLGDITEEQMMEIYLKKEVIYRLNVQRVLQNNEKIRTIFSIRHLAIVQQILVNSPLTTIYPFSGCSNLEILMWGNGQSGLSETREQYIMPVSSGAAGFFGNCKKLRIVYPINCVPITSFNNCFSKCHNLLEVRLYKVKVSLSLAESLSISKDSILYVIQNAVPTSAITITLHADAYARLADDADIIAALEAQPLVTLVSA